MNKRSKNSEAMTTKITLEFSRPSVRSTPMTPKERGSDILASLGMVATTGYDDPYRRVVEAELALEALSAIDAQRDAQRDAEDTTRAAELAERATYAGVSP